MNAPLIAYRVTHVGPGGDTETAEIIGRRGPGAAEGAVMALLTLGGTVPTRRRVTRVEDLGLFTGASLG